MDIAAIVWCCMGGVMLVVFIVVVTLDLRRNWKSVRCRDCRHCGVNYVTGLHGQGLYQFGVCNRLFHQTKLVDRDAYRACPYFEKKLTGKVVQYAQGEGVQ